MKELLKDFWNWLGMTSIEYASHGVNWQCPKEEFYYPNYEKLLSKATAKIKTKNLTAEDINDILTVMAIDNENEDISDFVVDNMNTKNLELLINLGISHDQPNARVQLIKIIVNRNDVSKDYLKPLAQDCDEIVKSKALGELKN